ncbi:MAG: hypothetical protein M0P09_01335 [Acholeplasmataceae bacterium]|nr:hypothetical protein [Acholeplasmataceae bacterium]
MEELIRHPATTTILGFGALAFAWKVLWPLLSTFVQNQTTSGRTESGTLEQLSRVLADAIQRAEDERQIRIKAEREREEFFSELVTLKAKLEVTLLEIESQKRENDSLRYQLDQCREHHSLRGRNDVPVLPYDQGDDDASRT